MKHLPPDSGGVYGLSLIHISGGVSATFDEVVARRKFRAYEFEVEKTSVTNGSFWISDSCSGDTVDCLLYTSIQKVYMGSVDCSGGLVRVVTEQLPASYMQAVAPDFQVAGNPDTAVSYTHLSSV